MKIGIVVPFSWSFWGAVVEHGELQAQALEARGHEVRLVMGNDPPGQFTRALHPRVGRHGDPPDNVIPIGRSVIVPANGSLPNIILSPRAVLRIRRVLERERFDVLHLHEPMTPVTCISVLAMATAPIVATHHASGDLGYMRGAVPVYGFLANRIDKRLAVSERARDSAARWLPGDYEIVPNGVLIPEVADPAGRENTVTFAGRQETRKGLQVLLRAWPEIHRRTGARLQVCGADPLAVRLLLTRLRVPDDGIDILGFLSQDELTTLLTRTGALIAPSLRGESFGMVLTRAYACALPVVASDIPGYREVLTPEAAVSVAPDDPAALTEATVSLLDDESRRVAMGAAARQVALKRYAWGDIATRLEGIYERAIAEARVPAA
ncbi:MAG: glycosyltransferase family 4 protein [Thermoleophilia bacterium]|nr:glycosyltransferase family 4 protein [Thermoleophilia bacterium]